jgi:uncharacterized protein YqjF (DUF2071 family)
MLRIPDIRGVIDRRMLVNYRVDPDVLAATLPSPFRPKLIHGQGMAGICLIRLANIRPRIFPRWLGLGSENAAHRTAVEWNDGDAAREGVYIRRRDTSSRLNALAGGRLFPGLHHHATFAVQESREELQIDMRSDDGETSMFVRGRRCDQWSSSSIFDSLAEASDFFAAGSLGYSNSAKANRYQGLELRCQSWKVEPLLVDEVRSSLFDDKSAFPQGTIEFDCALLMEGVEHEWHARADLCCHDAAEMATIAHDL